MNASTESSWSLLFRLFSCLVCDINDIMCRILAIFLGSTSHFEVATNAEHQTCRSLRERGGALRVADRAAEPGDTLIVDFAVRDADTDETLLGLAYDKHEIDTIDEGNFLPNLILRMFGMKVGEEETFDFEFPDPWEPSELSGRKAKVILLRSACCGCICRMCDMCHTCYL
jgi:hypothetical protein